MGRAPRLLVFLLVATAVGVAPLAAPPAGAAPWRQDRFLIGGWLPGYAQDASTLLRLEDAGFDYFHVNDPFRRENLKVAARLDSLAAVRPGFRLRYVASLKEPRDDPGRITDNPDPAKNWPRMRANLEPAAGMTSRSTLGWLLVDEPTSPEAMARIGEMTRRMRALPATAGLVPFVNLLPALDPKEHRWFAAYGSDPRSAYAAYVRSYLALFDRDPDPAPLLSFDCYPFQATTRPAKLWFLTLAVTRDEARAASRPAKDQRVPVWAILQSGDHRPRGRKDCARTFAPVQLRWQAWSAVAYGAKAIAWWTLSPAEDPQAQLGFAGGLFDKQGRNAPFFADLRALHRELHALGPALFELDAVGARHVSTAGQEGIDDERWIAPGGAARPLGPLVDVGSGAGREDALVTLFRHRRTGEDWVFVFNKSLTSTRSFTVRLARPATRIDRMARTDGRPVAVARATTTLASGVIPPGTGELFHLVP